VLKKLRRGFEVPEDMIGKQFEQHEAYRNQQMQGITKEAVTQTLEKYIQTRMAIERASEEARRADSMERFLSYLTTEAAKPGAAKNEPA
jgi:hypothetical protein